MKLLAGNSNRALAESVAAHLDVPLCRATVKRFADNEIFVTIDENVRGEDVFVLQSTSYPANDNLMELLICIDALKRASAKRITAVMPYFGYARQDRKTGGHLGVDLTGNNGTGNRRNLGNEADVAVISQKFELVWRAVTEKLRRRDILVAAKLFEGGLSGSAADESVGDFIALFEGEHGTLEGFELMPHAHIAGVDKTQASVSRWLGRREDTVTIGPIFGDGDFFDGDTAVEEAAGHALA